MHATATITPLCSSSSTYSHAVNTLEANHHEKPTKKRSQEMQRWRPVAESLAATYAAAAPPLLLYMAHPCAVLLLLPAPLHPFPQAFSDATQHLKLNLSLISVRLEADNDDEKGGECHLVKEGVIR